MIINDIYAKEARAVLRAMVTHGEPPPAEKKPEEFGDYAEAVQCLYDAYAQGGTDAVRRAFEAMARADYGLAELVAGEPPPIKIRWTARELLTTDFPEPPWAVPGIIPVGLTILAGRPKIGKSWLALQVAHAVSIGGFVLDQRVEQGKVFYLALEDSPRRLKKRLQLQGVPSNAEITFATDWTPFVEGGLSELQTEIERGDFRLVVIDTFSRAVGRADQQDLGEMTAIIGNIQRISQIYNLTILMIDHHRKATIHEQSPIDDIIGSTAKSAVADGALGLFREQGRHEATLRITGRDIEEQDYALEWDVPTCTWHLVGKAEDVRRDSLKGEIMDAVSTLIDTGETPTTTAIASYLGKNKGNISKALADLVHAGKLVKGEKTRKGIPYLIA